MLIYFKFAQVYKCNFFYNISLRDLLPNRYYRAKIKKLKKINRIDYKKILELIEALGFF